jgi:uncharacterized protein YdeI (YjbR/CyaY-like superfamily)
MHPQCYASNRKEFRDWFKKNHKNEDKVYLISYKKHTGKPSLSHKESMEEAICFGWIDTIIKRIDGEKYCRCFVKRKEKANWSKNTLSYAKKLIQEKKMTLQGLKAYERGLKRPVLNHNLPKNPPTPSELKLLLDKNKEARENFKNLAPSRKRLHIYWIEKAKRLETRNRRIKEVFRLIKKNKKLPR